MKKSSHCYDCRNESAIEQSKQITAATSAAKE
jgi:hypothetical protein